MRVLYCDAVLQNRRKDVWPCYYRRQLVQRVQRQIQHKIGGEELMGSLSELRRVRTNYRIVPPNRISTGRHFDASSNLHYAQ